MCPVGQEQDRVLLQPSPIVRCAFLRCQVAKSSKWCGSPVRITAPAAALAAASPTGALTVATIAPFGARQQTGISGFDTRLLHELLKRYPPYALELNQHGK